MFVCNRYNAARPFEGYPSSSHALRATTAVLEGGQLAGHCYMSMQPEIRIDVFMNVSHIGDIS